MVQVRTAAGGVVSTERFGPNVLSVPAVPLSHSCGVRRVDQGYVIAASAGTVGSVCLVVTVIV